MVNADHGAKAKNTPQISRKRSTRYKPPFEISRAEKRRSCIPPRPNDRAARVMEDTPEFRLASLQRKFRLLSEGRQTTVTRIHADRYRTEVFDPPRRSCFRHLSWIFASRSTSEDLWVAVLVRHPTATQPELEIAAAAWA